MNRRAQLLLLAGSLIALAAGITTLIIAIGVLRHV
jgi:hypothetical protein